MKVKRTFSIKTKVENLLQYNNNEFTSPDEILYPLLNIAVGGTRGMLASKITIPEFKNIYIPIVSLKEMLEQNRHK